LPPPQPATRSAIGMPQRTTSPLIVSKDITVPRDNALPVFLKD
jgi:hypothetical protein